MQRRTWAITGGAGLLVVIGAVIYGIQKGPRRQAHAAADTSATAPGRARRGPSAAPASSGPPVPKVKPPELHGITGSCLQEREGARICTDYMATPEEALAAKARCEQGGHQFTQAAWFDTPCDHAASNGGCWTSRQSPTRIKWFYGNLHADFRPGVDTRRVCGPQAVGYTRDGTPVKHDGTAIVDDGGSPGAVGTMGAPPGAAPGSAPKPPGTMGAPPKPPVLSGAPTDAPKP
jgi:hypothetical protein